jgi:toxin ParE1/3/4
MKSVTITDAARADATQITDYYFTVAGDEVASGFADALDHALSFILSSPGAGSPRLRDTCRRPRLRVRPLKGFPYLVIYDDGPKRILILRILHAARDIPASLREPVQPPDA